MSQRHLVRALVLGFVLTLAAQSARAEPRRSGEVPGSAWAFAAQLWSSFTASWSDTGCWIDPGGRCAGGQSQALPPEAPVGCWIDPHGGCAADQAPEPPSHIDIGCWIDPYGGCRSGS